MLKYGCPRMYAAIDMLLWLLTHCADEILTFATVRVGEIGFQIGNNSNIFEVACD